jgi:hypothetical protein
MEKQIKSFYQDLLKNPNLPRLALRLASFQHERLIHLLITLFFGWLLIFFFGVALFFPANLLLWLLVAILAILEAFYIRHYYLLENILQKIEQLLSKS